MATPLDEIISILPKLSTAELAQLKKRIDAYMSLGVHTVSKGLVELDGGADTSDEGFVLDVICNTLFRISGARFTAPMLRKQPRTMASLRKRLPGLLGFLENVDKAQRPGFLAMCVEMLYHNLQHINVPATAPMIVMHLQRIPALVDCHFPGYAKNNMLRMIIRVKESRR